LKVIGICAILGIRFPHYEETDPARAVDLMSVRVAYEREIGHPDADADAECVARIRARL
jgi:hypothetical protein